jgi:hypothetical protein
MTRDIVLDVFTTNALGPLLVVQQLRRQRVLKRPALVANVTSKVRWLCSPGQRIYMRTLARPPSAERDRGAEQGQPTAFFQAS